jgi:HrpA-like RNA helicase
MSKLPTLYRENYLVIKPWFNEREKKMTGMEYIVHHISKLHTDEKHHDLLNPNIKSMGDKILLIKAGTGSGKTTSVAPELYISLINKKNFFIAVPTKIIAKEKTYDVMNVDKFRKVLTLGKNIGFKTGGNKSNIRIKENGLTYMTQGVLRAKFMSNNDDTIMKYVDFILFDEFHLRSIDTDITLSLIKKFYERNWRDPKCPILILMSATFTENVYSEYLKISKENYIEIEGSENYPIKNIFPKTDINDYIEFTKNLIYDIHTKNYDDFKEESRDIIVFLATTSIIKKMEEYVHILNSTKLKKDKKYIAPIMLTGATYRSIGDDFKKFMSDIQNIKQPIYEFKNNTINRNKFVREIPFRKVFLSTNVAETGITIDTLKYCIDTGYSNLITYFPELNATIQIVNPINKFSSIQRKGRVGRKSPGVRYTCYTKETLNGMFSSKIPEIISQDITSTILSTIVKQTQSKIETLGSSNYMEKFKFTKKEFDEFKMVNSISNIIKAEAPFSIYGLDYINKPSNNFLMFPLERLYKMGFINYDYTVTLSGYLANSFSKFDIGLIKMLFSGFKYGANVSNLITIMAGKIISKLIILPKKNSKIFYKMFKYNKSNDLLYNYLFTDDFIEIIHLHDKFINFITSYLKTSCLDLSKSDILKDMEIWCEKNAVHFSAFTNFLDLREEIFEICVKLGINPFHSTLDENLKKYNLNQLIHMDVFYGLEEIKKIKKCIFDGFSDNLLFYNVDDNKYYLKKFNMPVVIKSNISISKKKYPDSIPKLLISPFLTLKKDNNNVFNLESQGVSSMDCYVKIDEVMI